MHSLHALCAHVVPACLVKFCSRNWCATMQLSDALDAILTAAFSSDRITKVGLDLTADLKKLAKSYPANAAFRCAHRCIDLKQLWSLYRDTTAAAQQAQRSEKKRQVGLSFLAEHLLGRPLDKAMQARDSSTCLGHRVALKGLLCVDCCRGCPHLMQALLCTCASARSVIGCRICHLQDLWRVHKAAG